MTRFQAEETHF